MSVYSRLLGHPFVFETLRPLIVGGVDMSPGYANLGATHDDVVLDVGCGAGDAMRYLPRPLRGYAGFDTDPAAIQLANERAAAGGFSGTFTARRLEAHDVEALQPTRVILSGLLHHLTDREAISLLEMLRRSKALVRIATIDIVFLPGQPVSNLLARLDRGRFCRTTAGYARLANEAGFDVVTELVVRSHPTTGRARYLLLGLAPR